MTVEAKICGLNDKASVAAAVDGGARHVGLVFYKPSPRYVTADQAAALARDVPASVTKVGLFVDEPDETFADVLESVPLDMLQLHGGESPDRVRDLKRRFGLPVMKAIKIAGESDLDEADRFADCADFILFDAKPPADMTGALPGGNALAFDWALLAGREWPFPWMLSGGLDVDNVGEAVRISRAAAVDVSSGVERKPGVKDPDKIRAFLQAVASL